MLKKVAVASTLALLAAGASAQAYVELGYTATRYEESDNFKSSPGAIRAVLGYEAHKNLAIEAIAGFGVGDASIKVGGATIPGVDFKVDHFYGIYAKPKLQFTPELEGFVRVGYARVKGTVSDGGMSASFSDNGFSYGVGLSYSFDKKTSVNLDYMSYYKKDESKATGFTVGLGYKF